MEFSTFDRACQVISENTGIERKLIKPETLTRNLCVDSLEMASLIIDLEDAFSVDIEGYHDKATVSDLVQFIEKQKAA